MMLFRSTAVFYAISAAPIAYGFGQLNLKTTRPKTALFLEDHIAEMIDKALNRQNHKKDFEKEIQQKNEKVLEKDLPQGFEYTMSSDFGDDNFIQKRKDRRLASRNPQAYCADRCVTTGNCDVFEDIFDFTPEQVMEFCEECVLSDDEEPCDVPETFYDDLKP